MITDQSEITIEIPIKLHSRQMTRINKSFKASERAKRSEKRRVANQESAARSRDKKANRFQDLLKRLYEARCQNNELLRDIRRRGVAIKGASMEHRMKDTVRKLRHSFTSPNSIFADGELEGMTEYVLMRPELKGIIISSENTKI